MTSLILHPLRVHAALTGLLALVGATACGWWLATSAGGRGQATLSNVVARALPKLLEAQADPKFVEAQKEALQQQKAKLATQEASSSQQLETLKNDAKAIQTAMSNASKQTAEGKAVEELRKVSPKWDALELSKPEHDHIILVWQKGTADASEVKAALAYLSKNVAHWNTQAKNAVADAATMRIKQATELQAVKKAFDEESSTRLAVLQTDKISQAKTDPILEKIKKLFSGDLRATPGEDFVNSAGIKLVWIPEGNFWIGQAEVTERQYNFVLKPGEHGGDETKDGVSFNDAVRYCEKLTDDEEQGVSKSEPDVKLKAEGFKYDLPTVKQWNDSRSNARLDGFSNAIHEWSSSTYGDGSGYESPKPNFPSYVVVAYWKPNSNSPLALRTNGRPISLKPETVSNLSTMWGKKSYEYWSGQLGFRVVLKQK